MSQYTSEHSPQARHYRLCITTDAFTGVAAKSATAGHLICVHWTSTSLDLLVHSATLKWTTTAGFDAEQVVGADLVVARAYTDPHTGGTAVTLGADDGIRWTKGTAISGLSARRSTGGGALSAGQHTFDTMPLTEKYIVELADAAGVYKGTFEAYVDPTMHGMTPLRLSTNEGLVARNCVAMGAGGSAMLTLELEVSTASIA